LGGLVEEAAALVVPLPPPLPVVVAGAVVVEAVALLDREPGTLIEAVELEGIEVWMLRRGPLRVAEAEAALALAEEGMGVALKVSLPAEKLEQMSLPACRAWASSLAEHLLCRQGATRPASFDWVSLLHEHATSPGAQPALLMPSVRQGIAQSGSPTKYPWAAARAAVAKTRTAFMVPSFG
jgi:hypothetical protein